MKFNWGTGITLFIILFISAMLSMVYFSFQQNVNLVTPDYYPKELEYQEQIDRISRTNALAQKPVVSLQGKTIKLEFPAFFSDKKNVGNIHVYRPSDYELDQNFNLDLSNTLTQMIDVSELIKGRYIVKLDWQSDSVFYFMETEIYISACTKLNYK